MADAGEAVKQRLLAEAAQLWPEAPPAALTLAKTFSRPYSTVYRFLLEREPGSVAASLPRALFAKVFRPSQKNLHNQQKYLERLQTEFEVARALHARLQDEPQIAVVRPVAYYADLLALVTEEAAGVGLAEILSAACKHWSLRNALNQAVLHCRRAGLALAAMQAATPDSRRLDVDELLAYVDVRLQRLRENEAAEFSSENEKRVRRFLEHALSNAPRAQLEQCGCHCDYAPFNVLADKARVTVLDFSMFKTGSRYNDVTYFHHRVEGFLHKPTFSAGAIRSVQSAFLEGYNQGAGREREPIENDALFRVLWMKHVINNYSAVMRNRVGQGRQESWAVAAFHRRVMRRYNEWLMCMSHV